MVTVPSGHVNSGYQHLITVNTASAPFVHLISQSKVSTNLFNTNEVLCKSIFIVFLRLSGVISNYCFHNVGVVKPFETVTMITGCTDKLDS